MPIAAQASALQPRQVQHEEDRLGLGASLRACQWQADLGLLCMDLVEQKGKA